MDMQKSVMSLLTLVICALGMAQIQSPPASPTFELKGTVGLTEIQIVYSRPSARGRTVAGELIPYNEVWRTGANASTKISFSTNVKLDGNPVPAGTYAVYSLFTEEEATIILSKNLELWGAMGYNAQDDVLRFTVPVKHPSSHYETFTISFSDFTLNSANLNLKWEHTKAMFAIESEVDPIVMAQIKKQVIDNTPTDITTYFQAATYFYQTNRDAELALNWVNQVLNQSTEKAYWVVHLQAKLLARLNRNTEAKAAAKESIQLAQSAGNPDYVRLNEKLIASLL
jgi:hypothetical protein